MVLSNNYDLRKTTEDHKGRTDNSTKVNYKTTINMIKNLNPHSNYLKLFRSLLVTTTN